MTLVHHMGGVIRKECNSKVTHLVANCTQGEKFRVCKLNIHFFQYSIALYWFFVYMFVLKWSHTILQDNLEIIL